MRARAAALAALVGCTSPTYGLGPPTDAVCPPGSTLTYDTFGKPFMTRYCTRCHASDLVGDARMGAPSFHDFDTIYGVRVIRDHVDQTAAAGPSAVNESMPIGDPTPTLAERQELGEWLACGAP